MGDEKLFRPGDRIAEKYIVERELGRGGMAVVVAARHAELGNEVAIKALHREALQQPSSVERLMREARAAAGLRSEHATRVLDVGRLPNGAPFLVLERLRGMDLHALLETRGPFSVGEAARAVIEACDAVAEAHEGGIVHRDLKPSNLFLAQRRDGSTSVKVLDFGIAKASVGLEESALTTTSSSLGTPLYMAPEQILDAKSVTSAVDVWALGVTLYELVSNQIPWDVQNVHALLAKIITEPPVPLRRRRADVPAALEAIVTRCLAREPKDRYPSARDLARALAPLADRAMPVLPPLAELDEPTQVDAKVQVQVADTDVSLRPPDVRDTTTNTLRRQAAETAEAPTRRQGESGQGEIPARTGFEWDAGSAKAPRAVGARAWGLVVVGSALAAVVAIGWALVRPGDESPGAGAPVFDPGHPEPRPTPSPDALPLDPHGPPTSAAAPVVLAPPGSVEPSAPPSARPSARPSAGSPAGPSAVLPPRAAPLSSSTGGSSRPPPDPPPRPPPGSPSEWGPMK